MEEAMRLDSALRVIVHTTPDRVDEGIRAMRDGAEDFLVNPWRPEQLEIAVEKALEKRRLLIESRRNHEELQLLVEEKTQKLRFALQKVQGTFNATIESMVSAIEARDCETQNHCRRAREYSMLLGRQLGLDARELRNLAWGALLHDVGKIGVPDHILLKQGPLSPDEWDQMRKHPMIGYRLVAPIGFLKAAATVVLHHHEQWDGSGYPYGKQGEEIPFPARIFMVADAFETITSRRSYKEARPYDIARKEIEKCAGTQFDPVVVDAFCRVDPAEWMAIRDKYLEELAVANALAKERTTALV
jgi:response regulator RpfG family c-di-GMP phosphodiesterase